MTTRARFTPTGEDLYLDSENRFRPERLKEITDEYHREVHTGDRIFLCQQRQCIEAAKYHPYADELHLRYSFRQWWLVHFPGEGGRCSGGNLRCMSNEHERQQDYMILTADSNPRVRARKEVDTIGRGLPGNRILDVAMTESDNPNTKVGFEVDWMANYSSRSVKTKATQVFNSGYMPSWIHNNGEQPPEWDGLVPTTRMITVGIWHQMPPLRTAVVQIGSIRPERNSVLLSPKRLLLDDFTYLFTTGKIIPAVVNGQVTIVPLEDLLNCDPLVSLWTPNSTTRKRMKEADESDDRPCRRYIQSAALIRTERSQREEAARARRELEAQERQHLREWLQAEREFVERWLRAEREHVNQWLRAEQDWKAAQQRLAQARLDTEHQWLTQPHCLDCNRQPLWGGTPYCESCAAKRRSACTAKPLPQWDS